MQSSGLMHSVRQTYHKILLNRHNPKYPALYNRVDPIDRELSRKQTLVTKHNTTQNTEQPEEILMAAFTITNAKSLMITPGPFKCNRSDIAKTHHTIITERS